MKTQMIDIKTPDGICDSYIAYPQDNGKYPAVLLLMDGFGLRPWLFQMAQIIAGRGYYVLLPNVLYRIRRAPVVDIKFPVKPEDMPEVFKKMMPIFQGINPELLVKDAPVFFDFLSKAPQVAPGKIFLTGYCLGGALAIRIAARYPEKIAAAASFHAGRLATDTPDSPHLLLKQIKAELYIATADNDQSMTPEQIDRLNKALAESGLKYKSEVYTGAAHGFTMTDLPMYNEAALKRHWENLFALLERNK